ncbi:MAG: sugar ABC transporter permease [Rhodospirillales bacterium]|nr:sugar ABC transporter permease [Rhodospirillales bacterium]
MDATISPPPLVGGGRGVAPPPQPSAARGEGALRASLAAWALVLPSLLLLVAFTHWPAVETLWHSLHATPRGNRPAPFVGLDNYRALLDDPVFFRALWNNTIYAAVTIPASVVLALVMALAVNRAMPGRALLRMAYFLPTMLPMIAVANIWLFFYTPDYGLFDQVLSLFGFGRHNWLGDAATALPAMIAVAVWKEAGFFMIFYLAALQTMPPDLHEAASLDGTPRIMFFRRVTLPLLMPTTLFVLVNAVVNAFRMIDHVVVMTRGGPDNATTLLLYYIYETGFRFWDTATAATLTVVLLAILAALAVLQFGVFGRRVHYR